MNHLLYMRGVGRLPPRVGIGDDSDDTPAIADQSDQLNPDTTEAPVTPGVNVAPVSSAQVTAINPSQGSTTAAVPETNAPATTTTTPTASTSSDNTTTEPTTTPTTSTAMALTGGTPSTTVVLAVAAGVLAAGGTAWYFMVKNKKRGRR